MTVINKKIIKYVKKFNSTNLSSFTSGNISIRAKKNGKRGFLITPSGKKYKTLKPSQIVFVDEKGNYDKLHEKPSSEWRFHQDIYKNKPEIESVVHTHSTCAVAVSCFRKGIPAFHYMVGIAGGNDIKCANYSTFGTRKLSLNIVKALKKRTACLISNHGQVAVGKSIEEAFELAEEVENLCNQYINSLRVGIPKILSKKEMERVLRKMKNYKKGEL